MSRISTASTGTTRVRVGTIDRGQPGHRETKPFFRTSEFWVYAVATAAVLVFGYSGSDELIQQWVAVAATVRTLSPFRQMRV